MFGFCVILWKFLRGFGTIDWPPNSVESQRFQGFVYLRPTGGATRWCEENIENYWKTLSSMQNFYLAQWRNLFEISGEIPPKIPPNSFHRPEPHEVHMRASSPLSRWRVPQSFASVPKRTSIFHRRSLDLKSGWPGIGFQLVVILIHLT